MYSGTTLHRYSGKFIGAHQKIDRVAYTHLTKLLPAHTTFPKQRQILHFEGNNGPDGIKRKSPARDEPWHFYDPFDPADSNLLQSIQDHHDQLVKELKNRNIERAAFEAAWLAHALVDGLTPAHHFPYEEKLAEIRGGEGNETRNSFLKKAVMPGVGLKGRVRNNWKMYGAKGLLITHWWFEFGISVLIAPLTFSDTIPDPAELKALEQYGLVETFKQKAREVGVLDLYHQYYKKGWTPKLTYEVRHRLGPILVQMVTLAWYDACREAGLTKEQI